MKNQKNTMKTLQLFGLMLIILILGSCEKKTSDKESNYVFVKSYCAKVTVGGIVGLAEKCFNPGDTVSGKEVSDGMILIRIAVHSDFNDGPANPNSFQENLNVPSEILQLLKK
jgi:hypothetical protein